MHTITTSPGHFGLVSAFLIKYYGTGGGQELKMPLATITTKDRFGLVNVILDIDGEAYIIKDIFLRMLKPEELMTKDDLIASAQQCFKVYSSYIGLRNRYDSLKAAIDILRDQNTGYLQAVKEIEKLYEAASKDGWSREVWSKESREWERYTDALPVEAWIA